jgi:hypothetical protein
MKKINLSQFRKKFSDVEFQLIKDAATIDLYGAKNTTMKLDLIINNITDNKVKSKFTSVSNGIDFAVIDI